ncbi:protein sel-1 homolog 2 isoform X2 [Rhineura floridana]|uniref:protein sel-1 homolog 2 isoform X2 n=1 Tax=Rhineura floridana TaxID=261503 RepID=UPI002AC83BAE|nr:protein sel-1 homolog 2 isoform X2 [Rhineura floridana]
MKTPLVALVLMPFWITVHKTEESLQNQKEKKISKEDTLNKSKRLTIQDSFSSQVGKETEKKEDKGHRFYQRSLKILKHSKSKKDKEKAHQLLVKAAEMGSQKAMEKLAADMLFGYNGPQNVKAAVSLYEILAEEGSHKGQTALGFLSSYGIGVEYNQAKALVYYTFASIGGNLISQMIMGYRYWLGISVPRSCEAALIYYSKVANFIATKLEKNEDMLVEKVKLMERAENLSFNTEFLDWDIHQYYKYLAERGDTQIQVYLGQLHLAGRKGLERDHAKAFYYFLKAANAGDAHGMAFLGKMHLEGSATVPQSNITALKYFKMAADKGNSVGLWGLGLLYFRGKGVPLNYSEAFKYFQKAAEKGFANAQFQLGVMYHKNAKLLHKDQIYPLALLLWKRAAKQGNIFARVKIGDYHFYGFGTKRDYITAAVHYNLAADQQSAQAMFNLAYMYEHGLGISKDIHLARRWYDLAAETSPDAFIPVFLAYIKLEVMHLLTDLQLLNLTGNWKLPALDRMLRLHWDMFVMIVIVMLLILLINGRQN